MTQAELDMMLFDAVCSMDVNEMQKYIKAGADVNARDRYGRTPLHIAAERGYCKAAQLLLDAGADPNARDNYGITSAVKAFSRVSLSTSFNTYRNYNIMFKLLFEAGADPEDTDEHGNHLLHLAANCGYFTIIKYLVKQGADLYKTNSAGKTPLDILKKEHRNKYFVWAPKLEKQTEDRIKKEDMPGEIHTGYEFDI